MPKALKPCGTLAAYTRGCRCEECRAAKAASTAKYADRNRERTREWQKANPEKFAAQRAKFREDHRKELREKALAYYHARMESDPEAVRKYRRDWAKTPKGVLANRLARHARRGASLDKDYAEILYGDPCAYCGVRPVEIDHIDPVANGGDGEWMNMTPACRSCNASKNDRTLLAFIAA